ncbi:hypothetical protein LVD17_09895 [Fulvivirga ulvae]|uniref:hypothetical protein n=1 Tax=Fulvivirga ulvae TaxID=2904245 RepID=UPI001F305BBE|nr:hypothetical protein [Fulvivirga ulvae]UII34125.1 hypothetical protein LVD17_09895 [Fulvivirga ulvae]
MKELHHLKEWCSTKDGQMYVPYTNVSMSAHDLANDKYVYAGFNPADTKLTLEDVLHENDGQAISITLAGSLFKDGIGYTLGYFWGKNTSGVYVSKLQPDKHATNVHVNLSLDYNLFSSADGTEVTYDEIMGNEAQITGDLLVLGGTVGQAVPHFDHNKSYGNFTPPYRLFSGGLGVAVGYAEYNSVTIPWSRYKNWLFDKVAR